MYSYAQAQGDYGLFRVTIGRSGTHTFSVSHKGERMFPRNSGYQYSNSRLFLIRLNGAGLSDGVEYIKGTKDLRERDVYLCCEDLQEGEYFLCTEVDWVSDLVGPGYVATCYGPSGA